MNTARHPHKSPSTAELAVGSATHGHAELAADGRAMGRFVYPHHRQGLMQSIFGGRYDHHFLGLDPEKIHRVLDIGAGAAEFACWIALRFPLAWVSCFEPDEALRILLQTNAPPGMRVLSDLPEETGGYDVVRNATDLGVRVRGRVLTIYDYAERS